MHWVISKLGIRHTSRREQWCRKSGSADNLKLYPIYQGLLIQIHEDTNRSEIANAPVNKDLHCLLMAMHVYQQFQFRRSCTRSEQSETGVQALLWNIMVFDFIPQTQHQMWNGCVHTSFIFKLHSNPFYIPCISQLTGRHLFNVKNKSYFLVFILVCVLCGGGRSSVGVVGVEENQSVSLFYHTQLVSKFTGIFFSKKSAV